MHEGDIHTEGTYTEMEHTNGETYTQRRHIHKGDIHMKEQKYGGTYISCYIFFTKET